MRISRLLDAVDALRALVSRSVAGNGALNANDEALLHEITKVEDSSPRQSGQGAAAVLHSETRTLRVATTKFDRMLDLGFRKDIEFILKHCPKRRQTLLLSATIPDDIRKLARRFMHDPIEIWTSVENLSVDTIEQYYCATEREQKHCSRSVAQ